MNNLTNHSFILEEVSPLELFGVNNKRFDLLKRRFPEVIFVARGNELKLKGATQSLESATDTVEKLLAEIRGRGGITEERFQELLSMEYAPGDEDAGSAPGSDEDDFVLHGNKGNVIKARTAG